MSAPLTRVTPRQSVLLWSWAPFWATLFIMAFAPATFVMSAIGVYRAQRAGERRFLIAWSILLLISGPIVAIQALMFFGPGLELEDPGRGVA